MGSEGDNLLLQLPYFLTDLAVNAKSCLNGIAE